MALPASPSPSSAICLSAPPLPAIGSGRYCALGWTARPSDSADTRLLRAAIVPAAACDGADPVLSAEAQRLATAWLATRQGVQPDMLGPVLTTAARAGGQPFVEAL